MSEPAFYAVPGRFSEPGDHAPALAALSGDLRELCAQVQGLLIHYLWLPHHGEQVLRAFEGARARACPATQPRTDAWRPERAG